MPRAFTRWPRPLLWIASLAVLTVALVMVGYPGARASVPPDDGRRIQELQRSEAQLYQQIAAREALIESQRKIYIARIRRLEEQLLLKDREIARQRTRLQQLSAGQEAHPPQ